MQTSAGIRRRLVVTSAVFALVTAAGLALIGFGTEARPSVEGILAGDVFEAEVTGVETGPCEGTLPEDGIDCRLVTVRLSQGPDRGSERTLEFPVDAPSSPDLRRGDRVVLSHSDEAAAGFEYQFADRQRRPVLLAAAAVFALAVVLLGRLRGLAALAGLAISLLVIGWFVLPAILDGWNPVLVAVLGSAAIAYVALYLAHGFNILTTVALLGTLAALALIVALSALFSALAQFSGFASEEAVLVGQLAGRVDINGLVLGGIVIGALGALDDMTVTQASAVAELRAANREMSHRALYRAGLRIGRDHVASTVNTLALAYAGAALPVMLLFVLSEQSLGTVANSELIATEIVRTLVGSVGLVASVPITTWLAARVVGARPEPPEAAPAAAEAPARDEAPRDERPLVAAEQPTVAGAEEERLTGEPVVVKPTAAEPAATPPAEPVPVPAAAEEPPPAKEAEPETRPADSEKTPEDEKRRDPHEETFWS